MKLISIWADTYFVKQIEGESVVFSIVLDDVTIYTGKAYAINTEINVNVSQICRNYLNSDFSKVGYDVVSEVLPDSAKEFKVYVDDSLEETYTFVNDWTYDKFEYGAEDIDSEGNMSRDAIINSHYSPDMLCYRSHFNETEGKILVSSDETYDVLACGDYAFYYQNLYGGWNSFLIEGNVIKKDTYTKHSYTKSFNNRTIEWGTKYFANEIASSYVCTTGWLSDEQSHTLVNHLLSSNDVYLHDLKNDKIIPVLITDNSATYKTYRNQGKKMVNYTINIKESQGKIRL